jgi:hypothetical protein
MHTTIDYGQSKRPNIDAMADIIKWLGVEKFIKINPLMGEIKDCEQFMLYCHLAGIKGFPIKVWYESFHGVGSWKDVD